MAQKASANSRGISHKGSSGVMVASYPDVCLTPMAPSPVPIPYANVIDAEASAGNKKAKKRQKEIMDEAAKDGFNGSSATSSAIKSNGDEAGTVGGIVSNKQKGKAEYVNYSFDVKFEAKSVCRMGDPLFQNKKNIVG